MKLKKIYTLIISLILILCFFSGCDKKVYITTGLKSDEIFKLSGNPSSVGEIMLILMNEKNRYEADFGADIWDYKNDNIEINLEDEIKEKVKKQLVRLKTTTLLAKEQKVVLGDDEKELLEKAAHKYYQSLSEREKELLNVKESDVLSLYTSFYMADRVYDKLTKDIEIEVSDEEARVVKCKYIFINGANRKEEAMSKASTAHEQLVAGNDFGAVAKKYSDSKEVNAELSRNTVYTEFENAIFSLESGQLSGILENKDGYYIFLCVSDYLEAETVANKDKIANDYKKNQFDKIYNPFEAEQTFEFNDKVWDKIELSGYGEVTTNSLYEIYNEYFE